MRIHYLGVRGSCPAPGPEYVRYGGHTPCVGIGRGDEQPHLILDAGIGIGVAARMLSEDPFDGTVLLTHLHWDHITGLPFFPAGDRNDGRVRLLLPQQENGETALQTVAGVMRPPYFPIEPDLLRGAWSFEALEEGVHAIEGFEVLAREIPHKGGRCFGYRITDGDVTVTFMPDHCPTDMGWGPDDLGAYHEAALALARDADVLIHDGQLLVDELPAQASFGHAAAEYAVRLGQQAGAKSVVIFHHRHTRTDDELDALGASLQRPDIDVTVAAEGTVTQL